MSLQCWLHSTAEEEKSTGVPSSFTHRRKCFFYSKWNITCTVQGPSLDPCFRVNLSFLCVFSAAAPLDQTHTWSHKILKYNSVDSDYSSPALGRGEHWWKEKTRPQLPVLILEKGSKSTKTAPSLRNYHFYITVAAKLYKIRDHPGSLPGAWKAQLICITWLCLQ